MAGTEDASAGPVDTVEPAAEDPTAPRPTAGRRLVVGLVVALVVLVLLAIAAVVIESTVRARVAEQVEESFRSALQLDAETRVDVDVDSARPVLLQLAGGRLDAVGITVPELEIDGLVGRAEIRATGVPLDPAQPLDTLAIEYAIPGSALSGIADRLAGLELDAITLEAPEVVLTTHIDVIGVPLAIGVGVEPGVLDGELGFTPSSFRFGDTEVGLAEFASTPLLAPLVEGLLTQSTVCVASALPADLRLVDVAVGDDALTIRITGDGAVLADTEPGSCSED